MNALRLAALALLLGSPARAQTAPKDPKCPCDDSNYRAWTDKGRALKRYADLAHHSGGRRFLYSLTALAGAAFRSPNAYATGGQALSDLEDDIAVRKAMAVNAGALTVDAQGNVTGYGAKEGVDYDVRRPVINYWATQDRGSVPSRLFGLIAAKAAARAPGYSREGDDVSLRVGSDALYCRREDAPWDQQGAKPADYYSCELRADGKSPFARAEGAGSFESALRELLAAGGAPTATTAGAGGRITGPTLRSVDSVTRHENVLACSGDASRSRCWFRVGYDAVPPAAAGKDS